MRLPLLRRSGSVDYRNVLAWRSRIFYHIVAQGTAVERDRDGRRPGKQYRPWNQGDYRVSPREGRLQAGGWPDDEVTP
jgi:hypothetical protein